MIYQLGSCKEIFARIDNNFDIDYAGWVSHAPLWVADAMDQMQLINAYEDKYLDLDVVDSQDFTYNIGEIELMVNDKSEIENAIEKIMVFTKEQNLAIAPVRGKVIEYLRKMKPKHYQALVQAGVVKGF